MGESFFPPQNVSIDSLSKIKVIAFIIHMGEHIGSLAFFIVWSN